MRLMPIWIAGGTRSGKTGRLVQEFQRWVGSLAASHRHGLAFSEATALVLAANEDNRRELLDKLSMAVGGSYPVPCKTPLGFISEEVTLFWPLLFEALNLKAQFPLRLRPETEQDCAIRLWRPQLEREELRSIGIGESRWIRQTLDLLQLAAASGIPAEEIGPLLEQGLPQGQTQGEPVGELLQQWRHWCLERGLLSYGLLYELYWRHLLPNPQYQSHLKRRYQAIFADDVDDYPAIARDLFEFLLDGGAWGAFTYNPDGQVRLGLNADPNYLLGLADRCQREELDRRSGLAAEWEETVVGRATDPGLLAVSPLPDAIQSLQTSSRAQLLRRLGEFIVQAVEQGRARPEEMAIVAPGLDEIARYTLIEILSAGGVPVEPLNEQRPLFAFPLIRGMLTLLALLYPGLGRLAMRDEVAEMLAVLSRHPREGMEDGKVQLVPDIDPVRAGLIADYCYHIDPEFPRLLPVEEFPRWDRLGRRATQAYREIVQWIETTQSLVQQQPLPNPSLLLESAMEHFVGNASRLPYAELSAWRELMETAQHFWEVEGRLRGYEPSNPAPTASLRRFIQLLRRGTITANPRPTRYLGKKPGAVTLATIFQYRSLRGFHRWQFWLDAGSHWWDKGGTATLFAAPLFLRGWSGRPLTPEEELEADRARLERILRDLLGRVGERVYLCHSDLGVNGTEQAGPLLPLIHASREVAVEPS